MGYFGKIIITKALPSGSKHNLKNLLVMLSFVHFYDDLSYDFPLDNPVGCDSSFSGWGSGGWK